MAGVLLPSTGNFNRRFGNLFVIILSFERFSNGIFSSLFLSLNDETAKRKTLKTFTLLFIITFGVYVRRQHREFIQDCFSSVFKQIHNNNNTHTQSVKNFLYFLAQQTKAAKNGYKAEIWKLA